MRAEEVLHESGLALQRRSLQRRLAVLVEQGCIRGEGQARVVRYFPVLQDQRPNGVSSSSAEAKIEPYVPVSPEGETIKAYVRQPRHLRKPAILSNPGCDTYCFRHQFAADLKANGDDEATSRGLGHISAETRRVYGTAGQASKGHCLRPLQIDAERPIRPRRRGLCTKRRGEPKP